MSYPRIDDEFDLRARAELSLAYETGEPPSGLFRFTPVLARRGTRLIIVTLLLFGTVLAGVLSIRPSEIVRAAIEHEYYERTLRGSFMDAPVLLSHLGLHPDRQVPGYPQLMRPCEIDNKLVFHLTTFFEKGGIVTVFAFDQPIQLKEGGGWWNAVYWKVITTNDGRPLILVSEKKRALSVAQTAFAKSPA